WTLSRSSLCRSPTLFFMPPRPPRSPLFPYTTLFRSPLATASSEVMLTAYDTEPDFQERWSRYFREEIVSILAEKLHQERRVRGWLMATRLSPRPPDLPTEGEEG